LILKGRRARFEWDERKNSLHIRKHKVSFETAKLVFQDPHIQSELDRVVEGEERWRSIGYLKGVLIVLVAHTVWEDEDGEEVIRILSARKATAHERRRYEEAQR